MKRCLVLGFSALARSGTGAAVPASRGTVGLSCGDASLSQPQWRVHSFSFAGNANAGQVDACITNTATGSSTTCEAPMTAKVNNTLSADCASSAMTLEYDSVKGQLTIRESWVCDGLRPQQSINFAAVGTKVLPRCAETPGGSCTAGDVSVEASLLLPVTISPFHTPAPSGGPSTPAGGGCPPAASDHPSWIITGFSWDHSVPQGMLSAPYMRFINQLSFNLTDQTSGVQITCQVDDLPTVINRQNPLHSYPDDESWTVCYNGTDTTVSVSLDDNQEWIGIRQSWACVNDTASAATEIGAVGYQTLELNCNIDPTGLRYPVQYRCTAPTTALRGIPGASPPPLPHSRPAAHCTAGSFRLEGLQLSRFDERDNWGSIGVFYPAYLDRTITLDLSGSGLGAFGIAVTWREDEVKNYTGVNRNETGWMNCTGPLPWGMDSCSLRYNNVTFDMGLRLRWACDDLDPKHPVAFTAETHATLPAMSCQQLTNWTWNDVVHHDYDCTLPDGDGANFTLPIQNMDWNTLPAPLTRGPVYPWDD